MLALHRRRIGFVAANGAIGLADGVGTQFHDAVRYAVAVVFSSAQEPCNNTYEPLGSVLA